MKNSELQEFLESLNKDADNAKSENDLLAICHKTADFLAKGGKLTYDLGVHYSVLIGTFIIMCGLGYVFYQNPQPLIDLDWKSWTMVGVPIIVFIGLAVYTSSLASSVDELCDKMFSMDILFDNFITRLPLSGDEYSLLKKQFGDFHRGDESRKIDTLLQIPLGIDGKVLMFQYYRFSYVVVTTRTVPNGKGGTTTYTTRTTYYRYGLIGDFPWTNGVLVRNSDNGSYNYEQEYETGSSDFNNMYKVRADSVHNAAKFLKPAVIVDLIKANAYTEKLVIEVNREGKLCISFGDSDLIDVERKHSLKTLDGFIAELSAKNNPQKLQKITQLIEVVTKHNDSNFS